MLAAGLLAKKAVELGLYTPSHVKTSMGPGSRVVTEYLKAAGLLTYLDQLGFDVVGYGCTTCIGNSGPLPEAIEKTVLDNDLVACSVLSGNRNFEARVHQNVKANFLMSPPLVVAFALAGRVPFNVDKEPIGAGKNGPVYLKDIWPSNEEVAAPAAPLHRRRRLQELRRRRRRQSAVGRHARAHRRTSTNGMAKSTYIQEPPFFHRGKSRQHPAIKGARALAIFGDSVTTDHISPAGGIKPTSPAGQYLTEHGVQKADFNSYGARRGNHEVMMRGTFANVRIKNLMIPGSEGGITLHRTASRSRSTTPPWPTSATACR